LITCRAPAWCRRSPNAALEPAPHLEPGGEDRHVALVQRHATGLSALAEHLDRALRQVEVAHVK
jgi:hypothetical protein